MGEIVTSIVVTVVSWIVLYFIIKAAVKSGMMEARQGLEDLEYAREREPEKSTSWRRTTT